MTSQRMNRTNSNFFDCFNKQKRSTTTTRQLTAHHFSNLVTAMQLALNEIVVVLTWSGSYRQLYFSLNQVAETVMSLRMLSFLTKIDSSFEDDNLWVERKSSDLWYLIQFWKCSIDYFGELSNPLSLEILSFQDFHVFARPEHPSVWCK